MRDAVPLRSEIRGSSRNDFRKRNRPRPLALQFGPARFRSRAGRCGSVASRSLEAGGAAVLETPPGCLLINQAAACSGRWSRPAPSADLIQRAPAVPFLLSAAWNPAAIGGIADWVTALSNWASSNWGVDLRGLVRCPVSDRWRGHAPWNLSPNTIELHGRVRGFQGTRAPACAAGPKSSRRPLRALNCSSIGYAQRKACSPVQLTALPGPVAGKISSQRKRKRKRKASMRAVRRTSTATFYNADKGVKGCSRVTISKRSKPA